VGAIYRDIRFAIRLLARTPSFTAVAALSLALGIGANSALFSMFNSLLWRPLAVDAPGRVVSLYSRSAKAAFYDAFTWLEYQDYVSVKSFDGLAAYSVVECAMTTPGQDSARLYAEAVSGNYFDVLRPRMVAGRGFRGDEGRVAGRDPVAVIGSRMWQRRFGGDPGVVGRTVTLNGQPFTIIGIVAPEYHGAWAIYFSADLWLPATMLPRMQPKYAQLLESRETRAFRMIGRLGPGVTLEQAKAAAATEAARLEASYPKYNKGIRALVFREIDTRPEVEIAGASNATAFLFMGVTGLVLLIACANVANLLLARSSARRKEIAMRAALGATRFQIVRQLLVESVLLALVGGGFGLCLGSVAAHLLGSVQLPTDIPIVFDFGLDARVVGFTLGTSLLAALAFGLLPALRVSRGDLVPALKASPTAGGSARRLTLGNVLVVLQVAASCVLLVVAGLCLRSIPGARTIDPGFRTEHRVMLSVSPSLVGYDQARAAEFLRVLMQRVRELPSIESAALARFVPLDFESNGGDVVIEGRPTASDRDQVLAASVDEGYFGTLGTRIVKGREFTAQDTATSLGVVIVNETMARKEWPGQDPVGKRLQWDIPDGPFLQVVGVAADGKYRQLTETAQPFLFLPLSQHRNSPATLVASYRGDVGGALRALHDTVKGIDPNMPVFDTKTMDRHMERAWLGPRLSATLAGPAGLLAVLIAAVGLYGVMAYSVSRRTQEIGIRMAIGATPRAILRLTAAQGLILAAIGIALGLVVALASSSLVSILLFGVSPTDPVVFAGVPLLLGVVAGLACYLPARRALRVDPLVALRQE
jgi:predicted permease